MVTLKNPPNVACTATPADIQITTPANMRTKVSFKFLALSAIVPVVILTACSKPVEKAEDIRPVRAILIEADRINIIAEFSGDVRARVESRLGFRVAGKIIMRKVDAGTVVKNGQVLMQLDPQDYQLGQVQANAALKAAESNNVFAKAEYDRYQDLRTKNFVSQAVLEAKQAAYKAAQASREQATAAYKNQSNQAGYTTLVSNVDGVVTAVDAEVGQVVAAGTPVVRVAQSGEKEVVIGIPENKVDTLRGISDVQVRIWARPDGVIAGKIREMSPIADPVTRTYTAKIAIPAAPAEVKLGMTAYVTFSAKTPNAMIKLPLTALFQEKSATAVWVVENGVVKLVPVQVSGPTGNEILIASGLAPGQMVVTAGVNLLKPGQKVKILGADAVAKQGGKDSNADTGKSTAQADAGALK